MIDSPEKVSGALDNSQPTGWEGVAAMANKHPKGDENVDSTKPEESSKFTEMKNLEEIHNCEIDMVAENPDVLGYNIDSKLIIWPERRKQAIRAKEFLDSGGDIAVLSEQFGQPAGRIQEVIDEELLKDKMLDDMLSRLPEGVIFRITPHAPQSVFR